MKKKYIKKNKQDLLNFKTIQFSNIVEQSLEDLLNELVANNYRRHDVYFGNITENKSVANELCDEINKLADNILASSADKKALFLYPLRGTENSDGDNFETEIVRLIKFVGHLKDINNAIELIKTNINELYKYPAFKKQSYIPEFSLAISAFFKENIDIFFMRAAKDEIIKNKVASELFKIISLGNKIMNEFFLNINYVSNGIKDSGNHVVYYSSIISLLQLISINSVEITFI
jgi:hypothetical protein